MRRKLLFCFVRKGMMNELRTLSFKKGVATVGFDQLIFADLTENYTH